MSESALRTYEGYTAQQLLEFLQEKIREEGLYDKPSSFILGLRDYVMKHEHANS